MSTQNEETHPIADTQTAPAEKQTPAEAEQAPCTTDPALATAATEPTAATEEI